MSYPVPWASSAGISSLEPPETVRAILRDLGFKEAVWQDMTALTFAAIEEQFANMPTSRPVLGLHLVIPMIGMAVANLSAAMQSGAVVVIQSVLKKP